MDGKTTVDEQVIDYAAFRSGQCIGIAHKEGGEEARREWEAADCEVREMPIKEACDAHLSYLRTLPAFRNLVQQQGDLL